MKTVYVKAPFQFELREEPVPQPGIGEALVRVAYCGICGSDVTMARFQAEDWVALGHEVSGTVEAIGPGVETVQIGQRVALDCGNSCGICAECRAGHPRRCQAFHGYYAKRSGFAEYLLVHAMNVHPVGDLDLLTASLLEPFGVALNMVMRLHVELLDDVLLIGPGPIGLLALGACKAFGARSLTVTGRTEGVRMEVARALGASTICLGDALEDYRQPGLARSFNKIIVTAPPTLLPAAVEAAKADAVIAYCGLGVGGRNMVALDWDLVHDRNVIIGPMGDNPIWMPQAVELLRRGTVPVDKLITHVYERDCIEEAFRLIENHRDQVCKVVMRVNV